MRFSFRAAAFAPVLAAFALLQPVSASIITYTSSAAFAGATTGLTVENYGGFTNGTLVNAGTTLDGITYTSFTPGPSGTLLGGIITNLFNSFTGESLGGRQSGGQQFFFGQDSFTVTLPTAVTAFGAFFNVNLNSGNYTISTPVGGASTGSSSPDTSTFVFAGLTSTTPFQTITLASTDAALGSYNIPELEFGAGPVAAVPEPGLFWLFAALCSVVTLRGASKTLQLG